MEKKDLILVSRNAHEMLVNALTEYVRENGEEMSDYFYNEHGIDEEDEEGVKVVKVLDVSDIGCYYSLQGRVNDDRLDDLDYDDARQIKGKLDSSFSHYAFWSFYIVRDADGNENLKYYMFLNDGIEFTDNSEPDHDYVETLSLADLRYIIAAIIGE